MEQTATTLMGVLNIDKPGGITSHDVVAKVRQISGQRRVGHTGTLDPLATGVLLVVLGRATRLARFVNEWPKTYQAEITLGGSSDTDDDESKIVAKEVGRLPIRKEVDKAANKQIGSIKQVPPKYAAIKIKGKKLYEYARAGERVEAPARQITVYDLSIIEYKYPKLKIVVQCSAGTYIRSIARDIGESLGTGGYLTSLKRTAIGKFKLSSAIKLDDLNAENFNNNLLPAENLLMELQKMIVDGNNVAKLIKGRAVEVKEKTLRSGEVAIFGDNYNLIGVGQYDSSSATLSPTVILV